MKLRSVLVGTKGWAEAHAKAYRRCSSIELIGICGHSNEERLNNLADQYQISHRSLQLAGLLKETEPDVVDIVTHPSARLDVVSIVVKFPFIKLINIEKPLALYPSEAYQIEELCRAHHKLLTVNHQHKFLPAWAEAGKLLQGRKIGDIDFIRASTKVNIMEQGSHLIDMVMFFNQYRSVQWVMGQLGDFEGADISSIAAPDAAMATLCFDNGVRALFEFGTVGRTIPGESNPFHHIGVEVYGTEGQLKIALNQPLEAFNKVTGERWTARSSWKDHYLEALVAYLDSLAAYVQNAEQGHICDARHSLLSFQVMMAVFHSAKYSGKVTFPTQFNDSIIIH